MHSSVLFLCLIVGAFADGHGSNERTCMSGQAIYNDDMIIHDGTRYLPCAPDQTACYQVVMDVSLNNTGEQWTGYIKEGGCMNPNFDFAYNIGLPATQDFNGDNGVAILSYDFQSCSDSSNCFDFRPAGSELTVHCYNGVAIYEGESMVYFSDEIIECRVFDTCSTVVVNNERPDGQEMKFVYTGCGDPYNTATLLNINALPYVPPSENFVDRQQACQEFGNCYENMLGLCICADAVDTEQILSTIGFQADECTGDLCNGEQRESTNPCFANPCNSLGSCVRSADDSSYTCYCWDGSEGQTCNTPSGDGMWCMTGDRVSRRVGEGWYSISDNAAFSRCAAEPGMTCVHYAIEGTDYDGQAVRMDFGECISVYESVNCEPYQNATGVRSFMNVDSCDVNQCNTTRCNDFEEMYNGESVVLPDCRRISTNNALGLLDFRVFPNCSVTEIYHGVEQCAMKFRSRLAFFNDTDQCQMEADGMVKCMSDLLQTCLSTSCPTLIDFVPGIRPEYHVVRYYASQVDSISSLLDVIFAHLPLVGSQEEQEMIRYMIGNPTQFLCNLNSREKISQMLTEIVGNLVPMTGVSLDLNNIMGDVMAGQFICPRNILHQMMQPAITMLLSSVNELRQGQPDMCNTFVDFANNMMSTLSRKCNFGRLGNFLQLFLPQDFPSEILGVVHLIAPMVAEFRFPKCAEPYNPCDYNPCNDQGDCYNYGHGQYSCDCFDGSSGPICGVAAPSSSPCDSNPCDYKGSCIESGNYHYCMCYDGTSGHTCPGGNGQSVSVTPAPEHQFRCEKYNTGCLSRKMWLCDYAQWRWTTLTVWLNQFFEYGQNTTTVDMEMPGCNTPNGGYQCTNAGMLRCRHNLHMDCNECYCADHEYQNLNGLMDYWRADYTAWAAFMEEYRRVGELNGGFSDGTEDDETC